ncbi:hypothetical protein AAC387_Pa04g2517 [Persea americana]
MANASAMSHDDDDKDDHVNDVVMPGFRFHPTEEELIEFYLRRKVEGKRFNVELITFLDLYRYDPWELPALAAIGEKEWFFYVPRDRKYRNGDRPNRVTTSGYWKATGADRVIKNESSHSIGLKKTLVFYTGKAPKGVRTSWIMNEYRLPRHESEQYKKAEISLCRVYRRPGVEDHCPLPNSISSRPPSSNAIQSSKKHNSGHQATRSSQAPQQNSPSSSEIDKWHEVGSTSSTDDQATIVFPQHRAYGAVAPTSSMSSTSTEADRSLLHYSKQLASFLPNSAIFPSSSSLSTAAVDDLRRVVDYPHIYPHHPSQMLQLSSTHSQSLQLNTLSNSLPTLSDKLWEWNPIPEASRDYSSYK